MKRLVSLIIVTLITTLYPLLGHAEQITITVKGMVCSFCAQGIKKTFQRKDSVEKVDVDLDTKKVVIVTTKNSVLSDSEIKESITDAGYEVVTIERAKDAS